VTSGDQVSKKRPKQTSDRDLDWMKRALKLADAGLGSTYPNPCVGAVVVRDGKLIGSGRSRPAGHDHAEVVALRKAGAQAKGATMYVTLEPCRHHGKTPPCTNAIIGAGIGRVVVAIRDPAPHAAGKGLTQLRRAGVQVDVGPCADEAEAVHAHYLHHVRTGWPYVTLKAAVSLDGQVAVANGESKWITGEKARRDAHRLRARHHAIAVGVGTVELDDPELTVRLVRGTDPIPVLFDSTLRLAKRVGRSKVLRPGTLVMHTAKAPTVRRDRLRRAGIETVKVRADRRGRISLPHALEQLGRREIRSLMVEGGGELLGSFVAAGAWERIHLYQAPRLLGAGRPLLAGYLPKSVGDAQSVKILERRRLGEDTLIVAAPVL
jgi:diaminohydroxyphosphoribosylaminopyrimidine deaminase/5-amino-6-(5-phosphoribosylamino)uracil reductase